MEDKVFREAVNEIITFINNAISKLSDQELEEFIKILLKAHDENKKILVMGAGRSGLVGRAFAMRLMHLGFNVYVLGDTLVPRINKGDVVIAISGSGKTKLIITAAEAAKSVGAKVVAITSYRNSPLAKIADIVFEVPGRTKVSPKEDYFTSQILGIHEPLAPLGTLFEDTVMIVLDSIIAELMVRLGKSEDDLKRIHANIEI